MAIKLHKFPPCVDYSELISLIEKKHNINTRDYAGKHSEEGRKKAEAFKSQWMKDNGYEGKEYVLDVPKGNAPNDDWPKDSPEMKLRIEINSKYREVEREEGEKVPYLDFWHQHCDEINRGGVNYMYLSTEEWDIDETLPPEYQNWYAEICEMIKEEVKDSEAYDSEEECLTYYVDW